MSKITTLIPLVKTAEIIIAHGVRAFASFSAAAHASRRMQTARIIGQCQQLIDSTKNEQVNNRGSAQR